MRTVVLAGLLALLPAAAQAQAEQQRLVDRATLAAQEMLNETDGKDAQYVLRRARATMICPRVFRAGFGIGGQGGSCVLVARDGAGSWSAPAFYGLAGGSIGFQVGIQDAEVMLMIMNDRGLTAVIDSQFKLGADASATFIEFGGGIEGATTAALDADIVGFTRARGLFAGISLGGSLMSTRTESNLAYYGRPLAAREIVINMEATNPGADPLREVLTRYGSRTAAFAVAPEPPREQPYALNPRGPGVGPSPGSGPVQQQPLEPYRR